MILIVAALKTELLPLIKFFNIDQIKSIGSGTLYYNRKLHLLQTGIGMNNARVMLSEYLETYHPERILNIGTAGALNPEVVIGSVMQVEIILNKTFDKIYTELISPGPVYLKKAALLTMSRAVLDQKRKEKLFNNYKADLVDMEAFALAGIAAAKNIRLSCIKVVSDNADNNASIDFKNNYRDAVKCLSESIISYLNSLG